MCVFFNLCMDLLIRCVCVCFNLCMEAKGYEKKIQQIVQIYLDIPQIFKKKTNLEIAQSAESFL